MGAGVQQKLSSIVMIPHGSDDVHPTPTHPQATPDTTMSSKAEVQARGLLIELFRSKPCMPIMVRLAWHDAGTFSAKDNTGGANASIRFEPEISHGANAGLTWATQQLQVCGERKGRGWEGRRKSEVCYMIIPTHFPPSLPSLPPSFLP